jgi:ribosomal protein S3AE
VSEVHKINVDTPDELLARILDAVARTQKCEDQHRRTIRELRIQLVKCSEMDYVIFEYLV